MATLTEGLLGGGLRGKAGNAVFVRTAQGTQVRDRTIPFDPRTPSQAAQRLRMERAARAWSDLDPSVVALWAAWAKAQPHRPPSPGGGGTVRPMNAFTTLYGRLLRLDPAAPVPLAPPARAFFGDIVSVECGAGSGEVVFSASAPNSAGIVTELLIQPLASRNRRTYLEKYRHAAFASFAGGSQAVPVAGPGWVACAYRFVNAGTGQATEIAELGAVRAG